MSPLKNGDYRTDYACNLNLLCSKEFLFKFNFHIHKKGALRTIISFNFA